MHNSTDFRLGNYRPIYLWAGPGTIRMNKLKFMKVDVDQKVHMEAHEGDVANLVVNTLYQNWIHLTYSWGFPPEIEQEDWQSFESATKEFHKRNSKTFAYIQSSNCVYSGSFTNKDWYAITPQGKKVFYYSGRYMTCFQNQDWINYLKERILDAINRGADGIFFDNMWYGLQPNSLFGTWLGGAGCYCSTCKQKYASEKGRSIPTFTDLKNQDVLDYIQWRAEKMTDVIQDLAAYARSNKPDVVISANDYDPVMRPTKLIFGIDFPALAKIQDVTMIENFALPKWEIQPEEKLVNNALTVRNSQPFLSKNKHLSVLSYDVGIGFDPVYPVRRILTGMAEAAALGCSMTTKGTEFHDGQKMTLLTAPEYKSQQEAIGDFHRWLEKNQSLYQSQMERYADVAILHPGDLLWQKWHQLAPIYFAIQQTLLSTGIPWKVITTLDEAKAGNQVIIFNKIKISQPQTINLSIINALDFSFSQDLSDSFFDRNLTIRKILSNITDQLIRGYHGSKLMRKLMDGLGMAKLVTHTPFFKLPTNPVRRELLKKINSEGTFRVISEHPVLIDIWKTNKGEYNIHLANYHPQSQAILLKTPKPWKLKIISPTQEEKEIHPEKNTIKMDIDLYHICSTEFNKES